MLSSYAHEIAHVFPKPLKDPSSGTGTGPVVDAINKIQLARGLLLRGEYQSNNFCAQNVKVRFGHAARDKAGSVILNSSGGIVVVTEARKIAYWVKKNVGGRGIN